MRCRRSSNTPLIRYYGWKIMSSLQIRLLKELPKIILAPKLRSAMLWVPCMNHRHVDTRASYTHMPWEKRLELPRFTFHLPQSKSMKRVSYRRLSDTWRGNHVLNPCCTLICVFYDLTSPTTKICIPKHPKAKPEKDAWGESTEGVNA